MVRRRSDTTVQRTGAVLLTLLGACRDPQQPNDNQLISCTPPSVGAVPAGRTHPSRAAVASEAMSGSPFAVAVAPNGTVYVTRFLGATAVSANPPLTVLSAPFGVGNLPSQIRLSPNGATAYIGNQDDGTVSFVDVGTRQIVGTAHVPGSILTIGLEPNGTRVFALTDFNGVYVIHTATRAVADSLDDSLTGRLLTGVAYHPTSPCMYIAARDQGIITTVDLRTLTRVRADTILGARIQNVTVSRDGAVLYATDIERGKLLARNLTSNSSTFVAIDVGSGAVRNAFDVAVTPDNTQVYVSTLEDGKVYVLERNSLTLTDTLDVGGSARHIGFSPSGDLAVVANEFGWVDFVLSTPAPSSPCTTPTTGAPPSGRVHPARTRHITRSLAGTPFAVAIASDGATYITQLDASSAVKATLPSTILSTSFGVGGFPSQVRISPNGQTAYVGNQDAGTVTVMNVTTNQILGTATVPDGSILTIGLSPDGTKLYALTDFNGIYVFNAATRVLTDSIRVGLTGELLTGVAFHPFAPCMYIAARDEGAIRTIDLADHRMVQVWRLKGAQIQNVAVSRDGGTLYATDIQRSRLLSRDLTVAASAFVETAIGPTRDRNAFDVAVTPDNVQLYVSTLAEGRVYVLDRATRTPVDTIETGGSARHIGFSAQGDAAVVPNESGWVDFVTSDPPVQCAAATPAPSHPVRAAVDTLRLSETPFAVAITPADVAYVTRLTAGLAARIDLPAILLSASASVGALPSQVRTSPNGQTAYVGNQDSHTITFMNVANNQSVGTATVPAGSILTIGLSPDGTRLYALTDDRGIYVINTATRAVVDSMPASATGQLLTGVAFHPTNPFMYVAARDEGRVRTINLQTLTVVHTDSAVGGNIQNVAVSLDGGTLYATDIQRSKLLARDLSSSTSTFTETAIGSGVSRNAFDVAVTLDNTQLYVSTLSDGNVYVLSRAPLAVIDSIRTGGSPRHIAFGGNGACAVIPNEAGWVNFVH
jgi:YVTN family beta-propeller protein